MWPQITIGERQSGKTTKLIKRSAAEGSYILVATKCQAGEISKQAREMGFDTPYPVTVEDYFKYKFRGSDITRKGILIDEVDLVLQYIFAGIPIREITLTDRGNIGSIFIPKEPDESVKIEHRYTAEEFCEVMENMLTRSKMNIRKRPLVVNPPKIEED